MPIDATNPTVIPATDERTFPHWYITETVIRSRDSAEGNKQNVELIARLRKCRVLENGQPEWCPTNEQTQVVVNDLLGEFMVDNQAAQQWFNLGVQLVVAEGDRQGKL